MLIVGIAGLICAGLLRRRHGVEDAVSRVVKLGSFVLLFLASCGIAWLLLGPAAIVGLGAFYFVLDVSVGRFRRSEEKRLIWLVAIAAEQGISLPQMARSYAGANGGEMAERATRFAELVESGASVTNALAQVRHRPTPLATITMEICADPRSWGKAIRLERIEEDESLRREIDRAIYLPLVVLLATTIFSVMSVTLMPRIQSILEQLDVQVPAAALPFQWLLAQSQRFSFVTILIGLFVATSAIVVLAAQLGVIPRHFPGASRFMFLYDSASIMRILAATIRENRSIQDSIKVMSKRFPGKHLRRRLGRVATETESGAAWYDSLRNQRILSKEEHAIVSAAERVGNLGWALEAVAERKLRRFGIRLRLWFNILFPLTLILFGLAVLVVLLGFYLPLMNYATSVI